MAGNENIWLGLSKILEKKIANGEYSGRLPGIRKFSAALGVHPVTLQKALRELERKKLIEIRDRKGTFVTAASERRKYRTIMFVNGGSIVSHMPRVVEMLEKNHYNHLSLFFEEEQFQNNPGFLRNFPADGFIFTLSSLYASTVMYLEQAGIPFVSTDGWQEPSRINSVGVDNCRAICTMLERLKAQGHRRIAFFNSPRAAEYQYFLNQIRSSFETVLGDDFDPELFMTDIDTEKYSFAAKVYLQRCACMDEPPTAFLLLDQWCHVVRKILLENGFDIPGDLSLAGSLRYFAQENLSAAWFDLEEIYCTALEQLFKSLDEPHSEKKGLLIAPRFLEGNTIAPAVSPDFEKWRKLR